MAFSLHEDDLKCQENEVCALQAIYDSGILSISSERTLCGSRVLSVNLSTETWTDLCVHLNLPPNYPSKSPPEFQISCPSMNQDQKLFLADRLQETYLANVGQPILFLWIEAIRDAVSVMEHDDGRNDDKFSEEAGGSTMQNDLPAFNALELYSISADDLFAPLPDILSGGTITDRKSTFQAHLIHPLLHKNHVPLILAKLRSNPKIDRATHNIYAFRIVISNSQAKSVTRDIQNRSQQKGQTFNLRHENTKSNKTGKARHASTSVLDNNENKPLVIQDCDDDGETQAGKRLLHLLTMMQAENVMIVVSRWYGGIHLGPDRFKHINNVARSLLEINGFGGSGQRHKK